MAQPLSIENSEWTYLITTRTSGSRLWLINNKLLEQRVLGCLARYQEIHQVEIYAFILMGNHYHLIAKFPRRNRAQFMRDFNSSVARIVGRYVKSHGRRSVWARRYAYQILPTPDDVRNWFFYVALNPVSSGLVENIDAYPAYNSYFDAISGNTRKFQWIDWSAYLQAKRYKKEIRETDFRKEYSLRYSELPGNESVTKEVHRKNIAKELIERANIIVFERKKLGRGFCGLTKLLKQNAGEAPKETKESSRTSFRPLVLSRSFQAKQLILEIYFSILETYKIVSIAFRKSFNCDINFPIGTYPPPRIECFS